MHITGSNCLKPLSGITDENVRSDIAQFLRQYSLTNYQNIKADKLKFKLLEDYQSNEETVTNKSN